MIALDGISIALGDFRLEDVSLGAGDGEYLVIIGPSGAGKTVLLELIAGLRSPDAGTIAIRGEEMAGVPPEHRGTALVYQDYSLFPHMTAAGNIAYGLQRQKKPEKEIQERVDALMADFGITPLKDRYPGSLSGGEQQRVAIARALATKPSILLLDEPFAALDPRSRDECVRQMQHVKESRAVTVVQVSHSRDDAYALADTVVVLIGGRVAQSGSPDAVFRSPCSAEVAAFTGMENILAGTVATGGSGRSVLKTGGGSVLLPGEYPAGTRLNIGIPAGCIRVVPGRDTHGTPGENAIPVTVQDVTPGKDTVTVRLEGPVPLTAILRRAGDDPVIPLKGDAVTAVFRAAEIRVFRP